jgi:hypothetical protein
MDQIKRVIRRHAGEIDVFGKNQRDQNHERTDDFIARQPDRLVCRQMFFGVDAVEIINTQLSIKRCFQSEFYTTGTVPPDG